MKTIKSNTLLIFFIVFSFGLAKAEEVQPYDVFVNLRAQIAQSDKSVTQINGIAADMKTAIQAMSLTNDVPVDATIWKLLHESSWAVSDLLWRSDFKESKPSDLTDPVIECFALYLEKLQSVIDPDWHWVDVSVANVSPPDSVPFSMPGMDPDAIEDPILRAEYLECDVDYSYDEFTCHDGCPCRIIPGNWRGFGWSGFFRRMSLRKPHEADK